MKALSEISYTLQRLIIGILIAPFLFVGWLVGMGEDE